MGSIAAILEYEASFDRHLEKLARETYGPSPLNAPHADLQLVKSLEYVREVVLKSMMLPSSLLLDLPLTSERSSECFKREHLGKFPEPRQEPEEPVAAISYRRKLEP